MRHLFSSPKEIPVPLNIDYHLLQSIPGRFKDERHFWRILDGVIESLETAADPVLHWNAEDANFALHMLVSASHRVGKLAPIQTDTTFRHGRELIGTSRHKKTPEQKYLEEKAEVLQMILSKI